MLRKNIASAFAAILFALAPVTVFAGGLPEICGDIGPDVLSLLNRYAMMDPANFCIRSMTLAETRCWRQRDQVIRQANMISQRYNLAPVVPGCQPPVLMAAVPPPVYYQPAPVYTAGARTAVAHGSDFDSTWLLVGLGLLAIGGGVIALTICEGGGGGGGTSTTSTSIDDEFNAQYTLKIIGAKQAYKRGFTGQGIVVGLIDTGLRITSSEFFGRVSSDGGFDFTTNTSGMPTDESLLNPHGTEVAGVLAANRNFVGMHGVAYNALIQPLRVFDVNGSPVDDFAPAINYAISHGTRIINGSYGPSNVEGFETLGHQVIFDWDMSAATAYLNAVSSGAILVFPAGNEFAVAPTVGQNPTGPGFLPFIRPSNANITSAAGGAYRDIDGNVITSDFSALEPNTIVVVGTNRDLTMRVDSNRCGVAKDWCMAAPATNIFTTLDGVYTTVNGTSFAAPQVAGAAAILKQEFPSLTGAEIVDILLSTATDLGTPGVDVVFGHGLLNLVAATAPVGTTGVTLKSSVDGPTVSLQDTSLTFGAAFGEGVSEELGRNPLLFIDSYHRGYQTALSNMVEMQSNSFRAEDVVFNFDRPEARQELKVGDRFSVGFISESGSDSRLTSEQPRDPSDSRVNVRAFVVTDSITDATSASLHYKDPNALALGFSESDRTRMDRGLVKSNLQNPYAAFAATDGYASIIETPGFGGTVRVAGFFGHEGGRQKADARNFGSQAELAYKLDSSSKISLAFGALFENGSVLGTVGSGAFKLGNGTMTMYSGIGGSYQLDAKTTLRGAMYAGWTKPSLANDSLITGMSNLITTAFNMGIERRELAQKGDVFSFSVAQPLRVENGSMQFNLPYARDDVSDVVYSTNLTQDMGSKGREIDLEAVYAFPVEDDTSLSFGGVYRHDAGHVAGKEDVLGVLRVTRKF